MVRSAAFKGKATGRAGGVPDRTRCYMLCMHIAALLLLVLLPSSLPASAASAATHLGTAIPSSKASSSASCDSRTTPNASIHSIPGGGNGPTLDLATADACRAACCAATLCTAWCFTATTRPASCPVHGCCFLKTGAPSAVAAALYADPAFTSGCRGFKCGPPHHPSPAPPPPPPPPPPVVGFRYATPSYTVGRTIATAHGATLRDPTTAVYDPATATWHIFCTHVSGGAGQGGYPGVIAHYALNVSDNAAHWRTELFNAARTWTDEGVILNASHTAGAFDAAGVFTPAAVRECSLDDSEVCSWYLWFGGVADESGAHTEEIGVATAPTPWGPFTRSAHNPVFTRHDANAQWCAGGELVRVDEVKPSVVAGNGSGNGQKLLLVKAVCTNAEYPEGTALPIAYAPATNASWAPPYHAAWAARRVAQPLFPANETCERKGFEEPTLYVSPADGFLHFQAHNHGNCRPTNYAHFISRTHALGGEDAHAWVQAPLFDQSPALEPNPVPLSGDGVFGGAVFADAWVDFQPTASASATESERRKRSVGGGGGGISNDATSNLRWMNVTYVWSG